MSRTSVLGGVASGLCLVLAAGCTFVGEDPEITIDDDTRPRSQLENLDLDAYSSISYEPGTTFSFSLTTVEPPVDGTIVDAWVDVEGEGLRVEGFSGERVTVESPVGLGQCFDDGEGAPECPAGWPAD
ncbi:hypothetical protein [Nocardioides ferulae]|uniref:hypothetical protein n=1 Tax=Nocardioides ferulae TaxID=2340821 RepID=UPI000EABD211|nr:hypothetical protein [Nocardioides ferulae]